MPPARRPDPGGPVAPPVPAPPAAFPTAAFPTIAFAWSGLPDYAARCLRQVVRRHPGRVVVLGTRPAVPIEGMEASLGQPIVWIDGADGRLDWAALGLPRPALFFQGGYHRAAFRALGRDCRAHGGRVVCLSDANWRASWRQVLVDPLRHRLLLNPGFDGVFVPGRSGRAHAAAMGWRAASVRSGLYGADPDLFGGGGPLGRRPKEILFVGRLAPVKNVVRLAAAFLDVVRDHPDWTLRICGAGELAERLPRHPGIRVHGFLQPRALAELYRGARALVLPSLREPWGLVVHEAALSGCALALSDRVGAAADLATPRNAVVFRPDRTDAIAGALREMADWDEARWTAAEAASRARAAQFGPARFADAVDGFLSLLGGAAVPC